MDTSFKLRLLLVLGGCCLLVAEPAVAGTTGNRHVSGQKERETDGAYSRRDKHHIEGEEHDDDFDHEAIIGSHKEADEYEELPAEIAKERLAKLILLMDADKDEHVSKEELTKWILRSFKMLSKEESESRWEEEDTNGDGKITWSEFLKESYDIESEDEVPSDNLNELKLVREDKTLFTAADKNGDGSLDRAEFLSLSHPEEDPLMHTALLTNTLQEKDINGDGLLSFEEFLADMASSDDKEARKEEYDRFVEFDKNKDGQLNREEALVWLIPSNDDMAHDEMEHLFSSADMNHDGSLSRDEIIDHHDVFVGSEATDYGEHLSNIEKFHEEL